MSEGVRGTVHAGTLASAVGALGIVFGAIGTNPLFAFREVFRHAELDVDTTTTYGTASIALWSLVVGVSIKYLLLVMRADNRGEGGVLALTSLAVPRSSRSPSVRAATRFAGMVTIVATLGVFGTALLYGDAMITPAISVLAAVEGFEVATSAFEDWVIPITVVILVALFAVQRRGTADIGKVFGPVMVLWFAVIGLLGLSQVVDHPGVLKAVWPGYAVEFFVEQPGKAFLALGPIFLVVAGAEALYADMGHFGRRPIEVAWYGCVLPGLVLNYFGQAAALSADPAAVENPFFEIAPDWAVSPLAALSTVATVVASQALISGTFSLTTQAIKLDYIPRLAVTHTSRQQIGQVYVPFVNWLLMGASVGLVLAFQSSSSLAGAYGLAVVTTATITTLVFYRVARRRFGWSAAKAAAIVLPLLAVDLAYLAANVPLIPESGWFPLAVAALLTLQMTTWRKGRDLVAARMRRAQTPLDELVRRIDRDGVPRVPGTAVYLFKDAGAAPPALLANLEHQTVLHERVLVVTVDVSDDATVDPEDRVAVTDIGPGVAQVVITHGFMDKSSVVAVLEKAELAGGPFDPQHSTFFLGDEQVIAHDIEGMHPWREELYVLLDRGAASAARFFDLPAHRVVTVGTHVEI